MLSTRTLSTTSKTMKLKLFYAICPDYSTDPAQTLQQRLKVRSKHWERAQEDKKNGILYFGRGTVPPSNSSLHEVPDLPSGVQAMNGSIMFMRYQSIIEMEDRIKSDIYYTDNVWDKEKIQIGEFIRLPEDDQ
ncbi:uncharacterized protein L201_003153 [Kwoniella dendrophila CBS 6074]|uniref:YCII-related domain-containing protein n=1 Tax=Kwoniella dendrophila CBS 6074 TaxID=1295534 RepID=A0AAX4JS72_9TREE